MCPPIPPHTRTIQYERSTIKSLTHARGKRSFVAQAWSASGTLEFLLQDIYLTHLNPRRTMVKCAATQGQVPTLPCWSSLCVLSTFSPAPLIRSTACGSAASTKPKHSADAFLLPGKLTMTVRPRVPAVNLDGGDVVKLDPFAPRRGSVFDNF